MATRLTGRGGGRYPGSSGGPSLRTVATIVVAAVVGLVLLVVGASLVTSFKAMDPGHVGVVQEGGPFDGRAVARIKPPGTGVESVGVFNKLYSFPATTRNYIISADPARGDRGNVDVFHTPTSDSVLVGVEGQALFALNLDERALGDFFRKFGVRTFKGLHPYDGDDGWSAFLDQQFRPVLDNALREEIGKYRCAELNAACALVKGNVSNGSATAQNIAQIQEAIGRTLQADLNSTLEGPYFTSVRFRLQQITLPPRVAEAVDEANAAKASVATQRFTAEAAKQQARAALVRANANRRNPYAGLADVLRSLPRDSQPIVNLNVGGGRGLGLNVGR